MGNYGILAVANIPYLFRNASVALVFRKENNEEDEIAPLSLSRSEWSNKEYPVEYSTGFGKPLGNRLTLHHQRGVDSEIANSPCKNAAKNRKEPVVFLRSAANLSQP